MSEPNWHTVEVEPPPPGIFSLSPRRAHRYQTPEQISPTSRRSDDPTPEPVGLFTPPPPGFFARSPAGGPGSAGWASSMEMETSPQAALPPQPGIFAAPPPIHYKFRAYETAEAMRSTTSPESATTTTATAIESQQSLEYHTDSDSDSDSKTDGETQAPPSTDNTSLSPPEQAARTGGTLAGAKAYRQSLLARLEACTRTAVELTAQIRAVDAEIEAGTEGLRQRQKQGKKAKRARARERKKKKV